MASRSGLDVHDRRDAGLSGEAWVWAPKAAAPVSARIAAASQPSCGPDSGSESPVVNSERHSSAAVPRAAPSCAAVFSVPAAVSRR
jgi:hypothetical protein